MSGGTLCTHWDGTIVSFAMALALSYEKAGWLSTATGTCAIAAVCVGFICIEQNTFLIQKVYSWDLSYILP